MKSTETLEELQSKMLVLWELMWGGGLLCFSTFSQMVGTGIFCLFCDHSVRSNICSLNPFPATSGTILRQTGSLGFAMMVWVIGSLLSFAGLACYMEYLAIFPNRAGTDVAYLEQVPVTRIRGSQELKHPKV
ncbi:hypothetical protein C8J56DRAFT_1158361, partial [Mycena floridula]